MTHLHFDHCGGSVQWNRIKQAMNLLSRTANGAMKVTGMGNKTKSERRLLLSENILPMQESGQLNFIKRPGDYLSNQN
jgi:hypothetical protein